MNKKRHDTNEKTGSPSTVVIMGIAIVALLGLLVWALTRTVEPSPTSAPVATALPSTPASSTPAATTATTPGATPTATSADIHPETGVERISVEDFRTKFNAGNVVIIDVRDSASYAAGHIPGAMNIPFASIQGFTDMIPKGKEIVTYCT